MNKITFYFFILILFSSCTNINKRFEKSSDILFNGKSFELGDILVKEKEFSLLGFLGHTAIIIDENLVGDYPKFGEKYYEVNLQDWTKDNRKIIVLRYKNMTSTFKELLKKNIKKYSNKKYKISSKKDNESFYCSKYIWYIYFKTANELGFYLDLDDDKGTFVLLYDFLKNEFLEKVIIKKREESL